MNIYLEKLKKPRKAHLNGITLLNCFYFFCSYSLVLLRISSNDKVRIETEDKSLVLSTGTGRGRSLSTGNMDRNMGDCFKSPHFPSFLLLYSNHPTSRYIQLTSKYELFHLLVKKQKRSNIPNGKKYHRFFEMISFNERSYIMQKTFYYPHNKTCILMCNDDIFFFFYPLKSYVSSDKDILKMIGHPFK